MKHCTDRLITLGSVTQWRRSGAVTRLSSNTQLPCNFLATQIPHNINALRNFRPDMDTVQPLLCGKRYTKQDRIILYAIIAAT